MSVYVLLLKNNKIYVGFSNNVQKRIKDHFIAEGCEWTKQNKPLRIIKIIPGDQIDEEIQTFNYMRMFEVNNVRGGSYSKVLMTEFEQEKAIQQICHFKNLCYKCNMSGHYSSSCVRKVTHSLIKIFNFIICNSKYRISKYEMCCKCNTLADKENESRYNFFQCYPLDNNQKEADMVRICDSCSEKIDLSEIEGSGQIILWVFNDNYYKTSETTGLALWNFLFVDVLDRETYW